MGGVWRPCPGHVLSHFDRRSHQSSLRVGARACIALRQRKNLMPACSGQ